MRRADGLLFRSLRLAIMRVCMPSLPSELPSTPNGASPYRRFSRPFPQAARATHPAPPTTRGGAGTDHRPRAASWSRVHTGSTRIHTGSTRGPLAPFPALAHRRRVCRATVQVVGPVSPTPVPSIMSRTSKPAPSAWRSSSQGNRTRLRISPWASSPEGSTPRRCMVLIRAHRSHGVGDVWRCHLLGPGRAGARWSVTGVRGDAHVQAMVTEVSSHVRVSVEAGRPGMGPLPRSPPKGGVR